MQTLKLYTIQGHLLVFVKKKVNNYLHFVISGLVIGNFFVTLLFNKKFDGISNELGMFLYDLFDLFLLFVLNLVLFQVKNNFGTTTNRFSFSISFDSERTTGRGLPKVLKNKEF